MTQSFANVLFEVNEKDGTNSAWRIERSADDSLSSLLERLSEKSKMKTEDLSFVYQREVAKFEAGELCFFAFAAREDTHVFASHDRIAEVEDIVPEADLSTNVQVSALADVFCPPGMSPIISIDTCHVFFELDGSDALDASARALDDDQVVAWIEAFRLSGVRGEAGPVILLRSESRCVDVRSGETFLRHTDFLIATRTPAQAAKVELGYLLLRHGSRLPKWPIAADLRTHIALRDGAEFCIRNGLIQVLPTGPPGPPSKRWIYPAPDRLVLGSQAHALRRKIVDYISS